MKKLLKLLKIQALNIFGINRLRYGHNDVEVKKARNTFISFAIVIIVLLPTIFFYFYAMGLGFDSFNTGGAQAMLAIAAAAASIAVLITSIGGAANTLFCFRDFDATVSLPIPMRTVVASRILKLYGTNLFFVLFVMIPAFVAYCLIETVDAMFVVRYFLLSLLLPAIPLIVASIISTIIARISAHSRKKSLVSTILLVVFVLAMLSLSLFSNKIADNFEQIISSITSSIYAIYPPAKWFCESVANASINDLVIFVGISIAAYVLFVVLVSALFKKLNASLTGSLAKRRAAKDSDIKVSSQFGALLKKESKRYFSSSIYVSNTIIGEILLLVAGIALLIFGGDKLFVVLSILQGAEHIIPALLPYIVMFFMGISVTTTCSISIEGKNLWQIKSLPINTVDLFKAKLALSLYLALPALLVSAILLSLALKFNVLEGILLFLLPASGTILLSITGLSINLNHARFDWKSDSECVKQSTPVLLNMLIGMAIAIIPGVFAVLAPMQYTFYVTAALSVIMLVISLVVWRSLCTKGVKRFEKLS